MGVKASNATIARVEPWLNNRQIIVICPNDSERQQPDSGSPVGYSALSRKTDCLILGDRRHKGFVGASITRDCCQMHLILSHLNIDLVAFRGAIRFLAGVLSSATSCSSCHTRSLVLCPVFSLFIHFTSGFHFRQEYYRVIFLLDPLN
jgi:hypothetical protein